ncbi:ANTAR domain-containing protein [Amycolatopsis lexingtonensis]|uniref:GAF and ANTAR domain-containing protein n=1 Tax=Amycolatopsis lexingtonensis TaxID=218822 RepID=UPI003F7070BF
MRSVGGEFHTPVWTEETAEELDRIQDRPRPCLEAARQGDPRHCLIDDLANSASFQEFGPLAAQLPPGAINLYSRRIGVFGDDAVDHALVLSSHASLALAGVAGHTAAALRETNLRRAIDNRDVIGQAKGILMNRRGVSADEAFDILRRNSQELNVKLTERAHTLTQRHQDLDG